MDGTIRRNRILADLEISSTTIKGSDLAKTYGVSRQVVVQDVALLRATGAPIVSTADGYIIYSANVNSCKRVFCVTHNDVELEEELLIFVDNGGHVLNIIVEHVVYGEIVVDLHLKTRRQVNTFIEKTSGNDFTPLMVLTKGNHYHTIEAESEIILDAIEEELKVKGFLVET